MNSLEVPVWCFRKGKDSCLFEVVVGFWASKVTCLVSAY